jgi:hypothetical protein
LNIGLKQVVFNIHAGYHGAKMAYINIIKVNLVLHRIAQLVFIAEMEIVNKLLYQN